MGKKRSMFLVAGLGCLGLMLVCTGGMAVVGYGVFKAMKSSGPYHDAMARVRSSPDAAAALGTPIDSGWMVSGSIHEDMNSGGSATLAIPVHGPNGSGVVKVQGTRAAKTWTYSTLELDLPDGKVIDLGGGSSPPSTGRDGLPPSTAAGTSQTL